MNRLAMAAAFGTGFVVAVVYGVVRAWDRAASDMPLEEDDCPDFVEPLDNWQGIYGGGINQLHLIDSGDDDEVIRLLYVCGSCGVEFVDPTAHRCPA